MTTQSPQDDTTTLLESFRHDFNHIGDGRILVEPEKLAEYIAEQRREAARKARIDELERLEYVDWGDDLNPIADELIEKYIAQRRVES